MTGFQSFFPNGKLQFDGNFASFYLHSRGPGTTQAGIGGNTVPSTLRVPIRNQYDPAIIATRAGFTVARSGVQQSGNDWYALFACNAPVGSSVEWWKFYQAVDLTIPSYGMYCQNEAGQVTYSSDYDSLRIAAVVGQNQTFPALPGDRLYATVQAPFAGYRAYTESYRRNGAPADPGGDYEDDAQWSVLVDSKLIGTSWNGAAPSVGEVSWDDVYVLLNYGRNPQPPTDFPWEIPMTLMMVADVTDI